MWTKHSNNPWEFFVFGTFVIPAIILGLLPSSRCITTTHYDKPTEVFNITLPIAERQKRLLPYMNYYVQQSFNQNNQQNPPKYRVVFPKSPGQQQATAQHFYQPTNYQVKNPFTPFTESNALPGPFVPMSVNQREPQYAAITRQPNFDDVYDKLSQLKFQDQRQPNGYNENYDKQGPAPAADVRKTLIRYLVPLQPLQEDQKIMPPKPIVQTYTATQVDVPPAPQYPQDVVKGQVGYSGRPIEFAQHVQKVPIRQEAKPIIIIEQRVPSYRDIEKQKMFEEQLKIYEDQQKIYYQQQRVEEVQNQQDNYTPQIIIQKLPSSAITQPQYSPQYTSYNPEYKTIVEPPPPHEPNYNTIYDQPQPQSLSSENPNLGYILRKLQETNALPQNLTPENIDNSIKTLMKILNALKKHQRLSKKPIVVPDFPERQTNDNDNQVVALHPQKNVPGTVIQNFPENTPEGGTPGTPGIDYPALSSIPQTRFNCKTQRYKGFFGDPDTNCQVWHYCDFNGGQASFLCPNGTIFSQVALTCDWWYNVKCATTTQLYVLNERLYKYILPFSPKFPEDYSGPLVDRYLALKFQEMEEKMKKERKKNKDDQEKQEPDQQSEKVEIDDAEQLRIKNQELDMRLNEEGNGSEEQEATSEYQDYTQS